ncbi:hypothetical protein FisN_10Lh031 [Fistulifera solaris]|uniref:Uncharacterized protein n=1 Tax=Fistulifera solaris TaxID=1519565 RepID=A0A1Z5JT33_FISSO|nr:hypothetical protein FisN_10Lh031 [Fistulifera solaris]|eukprot:GAX17184.1 hypothetical protein FisN_10Lh031 [Fistulifera solaris]
MPSDKEIVYSSVSKCRVEADTAGVIQTQGILRIVPQTRWSTEHFHPDLCVASNAICCQFQARARESLAVAFSPRAGYAKIVYEACFGDEGNMRTTLRRGRNMVKIAPSRVCEENSWVSYWTCLVIEEVIEEENEEIHNKEAENREAAETTNEDFADKDGIEITKVKEQEDTPGTTNKTRKKYNNRFYIGIGDVPGKDCIGILQDKLHGGRGDDDELPFRYVGFSNRAVRDRQAPAPLQIRNVRLSSMAEELATVLESLSATNKLCVNDVDEETKALLEEYEEQCQKARARAEKFGLPYKEPPSFLPWSQQRRLRANPKAGFHTGLDLSNPDEKAKQDARRKRFGTALDEMEKSDDVTLEKKTIPIEQAWDKENFARGQRLDPPPTLWKVPRPDTSAIHPSEGFIREKVEPPRLTPEKIHIFSIDWAAFKQIRTDDIMAFFSIYGPSYVEWLGDLSCNVLFQDRFSAARALENLSQEIPSPPPDTLEASRRYVHTMSDEDMVDPPTDLGAMGWRLCKSMLRKISTDRHGQRGTTARLLMRPATSLDILLERPKSWPKPPPGFSPKRVLGPSSDFPRTSNHRRKRENEKARSANPPSTESLLSGSLSATRPGFSVEELELERAAKRQKASTEAES